MRIVYPPRENPASADARGIDMADNSESASIPLMTSLRSSAGCHQIEKPSPEYGFLSL